MKEEKEEEKESGREAHQSHQYTTSTGPLPFLLMFHEDSQRRTLMTLIVPVVISFPYSRNFPMGRVKPPGEKRKRRVPDWRELNFFYPATSGNEGLEQFIYFLGLIYHRRSRVYQKLAWDIYAVVNSSGKSVAINFTETSYEAVFLWILTLESRWR